MGRLNSGYAGRRLVTLGRPHKAYANEAQMLVWRRIIERRRRVVGDSQIGTPEHFYHFERWGSDRDAGVHSTDMQRRGYNPPPWARHMFGELHEHLNKIGEQMAVDQATFDTDLANLVTAIGTLTQSVDAWIASHPSADLSAEDQSVQAAAQAVADELAKIAPAAPPAA